MYPPPESLLMPLQFQRVLLMGPGPSNPPPRVLAAGAMPILGHLHPEFWPILEEVKEGLRYVFQTKNRLTLAVSGTGHAAMEAACVNMLEPGERVLVAVNGLWGERFADMAEREGGDVRIIKKTPGNVFSLEEIEKALIEHKPALFFITQGESTGTTLQPMEGLGDLCHKYDCLSIVDSVAAMGGVPLLTDEWKLDVVYSGSQKVLSVPPGVAPITFNDRAWEKIQRRKTKVRSFYFDIKLLGNYWGCDDQPRAYHHTVPISNIYQLREGLAMVAEEGLEQMWKRHKGCSEILYKGIQDLGLEFYVADPEHRLPTVTSIKVPPGVDWKAVSQHARDKYHVEISGGLGCLVGSIWRVGVMGYNAKPHNVKLWLRAFADAMQIPTAKL